MNSDPEGEYLNRGHQKIMNLVKYLTCQGSEVASGMSLLVWSPKPKQ